MSSVMCNKVLPSDTEPLVAKPMCYRVDKTSIESRANDSFKLVQVVSHILALLSQLSYSLESIY